MPRLSAGPRAAVTLASRFRIHSARAQYPDAPCACIRTPDQSQCRAVSPIHFETRLFGISTHSKQNSRRRRTSRQRDLHPTVFAHCVCALISTPTRPRVRPCKMLYHEHGTRDPTQEPCTACPRVPVVEGAGSAARSAADGAGRPIGGRPFKTASARLPGRKRRGRRKHIKATQQVGSRGSLAGEGAPRQVPTARGFSTAA